MQVVVDGRTESVGGTSCASPIFASVIALVNDALLAAGKAPLGFLNPWLYANPQAFNDITTGACAAVLCVGSAADAGWCREQPGVWDAGIPGAGGLGPGDGPWVAELCRPEGRRWCLSCMLPETITCKPKTCTLEIVRCHEIGALMVLIHCEVS